MSSNNNKADTSCCASCGIAQVDDIKLKECTNCDLVRYCSDECQQDHKSKHEEAYKRQAAVIRDELLFKQPESTHLGDCPICCLPLPFNFGNPSLMTCCSKSICDGCTNANVLREIEAKMVNKCPYCREPWHITVEEGDKLRMKRVEANDPVALTDQGSVLHKKGDYTGAVEYWTRAVELGHVEAHLKLAVMYKFGSGVVEKDRGKLMYHMEEAAIGGHPLARFKLGAEEGISGNADRAVKHYIIAARQGYDDAMKALMKLFKADVALVSKEDLAATLRAHQAALDAFKSPQREEAGKFRQFLKIDE